MKKKLAGVIYLLAVICGFIGGIGVIGSLAEFDFTFFVPCIALLLIARLFLGIAETIKY